MVGEAEEGDEEDIDGCIAGDLIEVGTDEGVRLIVDVVTIN